MGYLDKSSLFVAMAVIATLDAVSGILSFQEKAYLGVLMALMFVPLDLMVLKSAYSYTDADVPPPSYTVVKSEQP